MNNIIRDNSTSGSNGGGIYSLASTLTVIGNVFVGNSAYRGAGILYSGASGQIAGNTIVSNVASYDGGGIYLSSSSAALSLSNNIVANNVGGGIYNGGSSTLSKNDVFGNDANGKLNYNWTPIPDTDLVPIDPGLTPDNMHIQPNSPCINAGDDSAVQAGRLDIDGQPRINGAHVDIGADESDGCGWYYLTLSVSPEYGTPGQEVTVTAHVTNWNGQAVPGITVCFSVSCGGDLTGINGSPLPPGQTTGCGPSDATATVRRGTIGMTKVTAQADNSCGDGQTVKTIYALFPSYVRVGFLYDLCYEALPPSNVRTFVDEYLTRIDQADEYISYQRIMGTAFTIGDLSPFDTVFLVLPVDNLGQQQLTALHDFVEAGRQKRIVLVGEWNPGWSDYNQRLNSIVGAAGLAMGTRFSTSGGVIDEGIDRNRLCGVNSDHCLAMGVTNLWDAATGTFASGWEAYARPLTFVSNSATVPWIVEEDTSDAGSRILIHDSSMFQPDYNNEPGRDTVPDKNFKLIQNLCTMFPD